MTQHYSEQPLAERNAQIVERIKAGEKRYLIAEATG